MEYAAKLMQIVNFSIVMWVYVNNAIMDSWWMQMELAKPGQTVIQLTKDVPNGLTTHVKHVQLNIISMQIMYVLL